MLDFFKGMLNKSWKCVTGIFVSKAITKESAQKPQDKEFVQPNNTDAKTLESTTTDANMSSENVYKNEVPEEYLPTEDIYEVDISEEEIAHMANSEVSHKKGFTLTEEALHAIKAMKEKK